MGLGVAENAALTSMKVHKRAFDTLSQNVANANNEDYSVKQVKFRSNVVNGEGVGVELGPIVRRLDEFVQSEFRNNFSILGGRDIIDDYNDRVQILFGKPGQAGTLSESLDDFFGLLKLSTSTPEIRLQVVQKAKALADKISGIAYGLQELRYSADREIYETIQYVNQNLSQLGKVQEALAAIAGSSADNTSLLDERDAIIKNIAGLMDVKVYYNSANIAFISASGGVPLFSGIPYEMRYSQAPDIFTFINNLGVNDINIVPVGTPENDITAAVQVVVGGKDGSITSKIKDGKLSGLLYLRDQQLPSMVAQLDNFATVLRDKVNAVHNNGGGMPPANKLTGTTSISSNDYNQFFGKVRIGATNDLGRPLLRSDGSALNALTLDLSSLDSGLGAGSVNMQTIVDEINQYFYYDPLMAKTSIGPSTEPILEDIRIASRTTNMVANGIFDFDFELVNNAVESCIFQVSSINVYDNTTALVPGAITTSLPVSKQVLNGERLRTSGIQANFGAGAGGPYRLEANVNVTKPDGTVYSGIINFEIDDTPSGGPNIMNDRYTATSISGSDLFITTPSSTVNYLQAKIVDEAGDVVGPGVPGFLQIEGLNENFRLSIAELNSKELGFTYANGFKIEASNKGFSHYFGLNNLFADDGKNESVAAKFAIEQRIVDNPNLFSIGRLERSASYVSEKVVGDNTASAFLVFSGNPTAGSTITMNGQTFTFVAVATLPSEIQIGASLGATMANLSATLGAANAYTSGSVSKAAFTDNGLDTLSIAYRGPGTVGNAYSFGWSLLGGAQASPDGSSFTVSNTAALSGGTDKTINYNVSPNSYEISFGSAQVALDMLQVNITTYFFDAAGGIPSISGTIGGYAGAIISYAAVAAKDAKESYKKQQMLTDAFEQKMREGSGVNVDEEMANTVVYQNTYVASATIFSTTKKLYDVLLDTMRS